jgi:hypothetical protein
MTTRRGLSSIIEQKSDWERRERGMIQAVKATDRYESQLFVWDAERRVISLPHGKEIWYAQLGKDGQFRVIASKPKQSHK